MKPIFIAGPHGSGKTTLISKLIVKSDRFIKDDYEIDFSNDMETLSSMTIFEKCLIRLYHRFYTAELAIKKCGMSKENDKILVVDRSIYDSLVYIEVEYKLGELSDEQYHKLREIVDNSLASVVFRNGGYAFNVRYDEKLHESNWHELINDIEDENVFLSYLMKNSEVALSDCKKVQNNFFRLHMNEIGVICLNDIEYQIFLGSFNRDKKIVEYIKKVSHKKEEKYYLRGRYYYYWLGVCI